MKLGHFTTIKSAKAANAAAGLHFFEAGALRFFASIIYPQMYGGRLFITSERFESRHGNGPRMWTVRVIGDGGHVTTKGDFQAYKTHDAARRAARGMVDAAMGGTS